MLVAGLTRILRRLGFLGGEPYVSAATRIDEDLVRFYREERWRLFVFVAWHLAGWTLGILETYLILRGLRLDVSLAESWRARHLG